MPNGNLIVVMGDQLSLNLSALRAGVSGSDRVLMVEVMEEATYVPHHKKKIAFIFSAMRHFAHELREQGWQVDYVKLDEEGNTGRFRGEVARACERLAPGKVIVTEPGEWRVLDDVRGWEKETGLDVDILPDDRFLASRERFARWADGRKLLRMEYFYREMRRDTGLLMDGDNPTGGQWNFDQENRKPASADLFMPAPTTFGPDETTKEVLELVANRFPENFGTLEPFAMAVTRAQAREAFDGFVESALPSFGDYQDAMVTGEKYLYHAVISAYLNVGLLDPLEVCQRVEEEYRAGRVPLNSAEGFIRQIIGWREYVRGIYWLKMPDYAGMNALDAKRDLPWFYWSGEADMTCLQEAIGQTRDEAYAHHIQRLMITGNFALLIGVEPRQIHEWYLSVYADAFEWVELPNTLGMSQFADGGLLGSKPYAAGGNYINRMSDHCEKCTYKVQEKHGDQACPFNYLYWSFLDRNRERLQQVMRLRQVYSTWDRMGAEKQKLYLDSAEAFLSKIASEEMT